MGVLYQVLLAMYSLLIMQLQMHSHSAQRAFPKGYLAAKINAPLTLALVLQLRAKLDGYGVLVPVVGEVGQGELLLLLAAAQLSQVLLRLRIVRVVALKPKNIYN